MRMNAQGVSLMSGLFSVSDSHSSSHSMDPSCSDSDSMADLELRAVLALGSSGSVGDGKPGGAGRAAQGPITTGYLHSAGPDGSKSDGRTEWRAMGRLAEGFSLTFSVRGVSTEGGEASSGQSDPDARYRVQWRRNVMHSRQASISGTR